MILTDYYLMQEVRVCKSHRFDCVASTGEYEPFEVIARRGKERRFFCYYTGVPDKFSAHAQRKAERVFSNSKNISSVYVPEVVEQPLKAYGDVKDTNDAMLCLFTPDYKQVEIFIARGYKNNVQGLFALLLDGELDGEMATMRERATRTFPLPEHTVEG